MQQQTVHSTWSTSWKITEVM